MFSDPLLKAERTVLVNSIIPDLCSVLRGFLEMFRKQTPLYYTLTASFVRSLYNMMKIAKLGTAYEIFTPSQRE